MLILSLFPGIDLLGRAFEQEGFCVVRGPDLIFGGNIEAFHAKPNTFDGIIAGSPCQDFSKARRAPPTGEGLRMLEEFARVVNEAQPAWWLLENVAQVPDVQIPGYTVQRFDLNARECGMRQARLRHFQFGSRRGLTLIPERQTPSGTVERIALATEGRKQNRRTFADFCQAQGLPRDFDVPGLTRAAKYAAVGNGVPIGMGRVVARAILAAMQRTAAVPTCVCGCGRILRGKQRAATAACRKRLERRRRRDRVRVIQSDMVTANSVSS